MKMWDSSISDDPNALSLVEDMLDLIQDRGSSVLEALTAMVNLTVALSITLAKSDPEADALVGIRSLTRTMVERVKAATGHNEGTA